MAKQQLPRQRGAERVKGRRVNEPEPFHRGDDAERKGEARHRSPPRARRRHQRVDHRAPEESARAVADPHRQAPAPQAETEPGCDEQPRQNQDRRPGRAGAARIRPAVHVGARRLPAPATPCVTPMTTDTTTNSATAPTRRE